MRNGAGPRVRGHAKQERVQTAVNNAVDDGEIFTQALAGSKRVSPTTPKRRQEYIKYGQMVLHVLYLILNLPSLNCACISGQQNTMMMFWAQK